MSIEIWPLALYAGLALLIVLGIFLGAARLVNAARKGNMRFKWRARQYRDPH